MTTRQPLRPPLAGRSWSTRRTRLPGWRREALRTKLWVVPTVLVVLSVALFFVVLAVDRAAERGTITLPDWVNTGGSDAARAILTAIAASVITVVGVVFSITILALTLASTQFGPRMLRNFIRDRGTQLTLGTFVATFVFCVLALASVTSAPAPVFVPHLCVAVALGLTLADLGVLIYFIHHVSTSIQINEVIHGIAQDLDRAIDTVADEASHPGAIPPPDRRALSLAEVVRRLDEDGLDVPAPTSGYLQAIGRPRLVRIATRAGAVVRIVHRPGHFVVKGRPLAVVWPASAAPVLSRQLKRAHVVGPNRTLAEDLQFAIDQLVEIALRALSPAVNDTFTALTCIDWLGDALCKVLASGLPDGVLRDDKGDIRVVGVALTYDRLVNRAFDKVRQAGRGMPAVGIRQLENLAKMAEYAATDAQRGVLVRQADMILRLTEQAIAEPNDVEDVREAYEGITAAIDTTGTADHSGVASQAGPDGSSGARHRAVVGVPRPDGESG